MISPVRESALYGLGQARNQMRTAAREIATASLDRAGRPISLSRSLVELKQGEQAARANLKTLATAFDTIGTLIDEMA